MPKKNNMAYNLGKIRQSNRINIFDKKNPPEYRRQLFIDQQLKEKKENDARELLLKQKRNKPRLLILYDTTLDDTDGLEYMKFITDETGNYSVIYYNGSDKLVNTIEEQYNLGFRFFLSPTIDSNTLYNYCIAICKKYTDILLISTNSTTYFENGEFPYNIIRTSSNDKELIEYITDDLLYDLNNLTEDISKMYNYPISDTSYYFDNSGNALEFQPPLFSKVVYIYTEKDINGNLDFYADNYGKQLYEYIKSISSQIYEVGDATLPQNEAINQNNKKWITAEPISLSMYSITTSQTFPQELKDLLSENPVSDINNFMKSKKTMFIINSSSPEQILSLFDEKYMYDNYFIFGDQFMKKKYTSKYKFNYAIIPTGNYSFDGFKLAGIIPRIDGKYISPFVYSISDIILKLLPYYTQHINQNTNLDSLTLMISFIEKIKAIKFIINNNEWYEKKIFTYYVESNIDDETNTQYNRHIFYNYKFNPTTNGKFIEDDSDIDKFLYNDSITINNNNNLFNAISLKDFGWNSRDSIVFNLNTFIDNEYNTLFFFNNNSDIKNWIDKLNISVGGNRNNNLVDGNYNHTPILFEIWRSHDLRFNIMKFNIEYDLVVDYTTDNIEHNINKNIIINRECYQNAGINGSIPENNFINTETEEITIDTNIDFNPASLLSSKKESLEYYFIQYFKGTKYIKSFNGLSMPYFAPIIINVKINIAVITERFNINDFVISKKNSNIGKIVSISNNYKEIYIEKYVKVAEIKDSNLYLLKDDTYFTESYLNLSSLSINMSRIIDYTNWKVFKKNLFIRSIFMDSIIENDSQQNMVMSYDNFGGDTRENICQVIKDNLSVTFSTYNNWNIWKNKMEEVKNNNKLQTEIFWEMYRSNKLTYLETSVNYKLPMYKFKSKTYDINTIVEINRITFTDLYGTFDSSENLLIPINFKTSDILPDDIIEKPIIYVEYFSGHKYKTNFNGVKETYLSPLVISINIIPNIIRTEYKVNDYIVYYDNNTQKEKIGIVVSFTDNYSYIEIIILETIVIDNTFYVKKLYNNLYTATQSEIYLYSDEYNYPIINLDTINNLVTDKNIIIYNSNIIDLIINADYFNNEKVLYSYFSDIFNDEVVELIKNNYFIIFSDNNTLEFWKQKLNNEIIQKNNHTLIFYEICRSHNKMIEPLSINIDYKLKMDNLNRSNYHILKTLNLSRKIFDSSLNNVVSYENFNIDVSFNIGPILPSDVSGNPVMYVNYFKGNKYLKYTDELFDYYSPLIVSINIISINIPDGMEKNKFVIYNNKLYKVIDFSDNFNNVYLQLYTIIELNTINIYIKEDIETQISLSLINNENILPYNQAYKQELIDITEWGIFTRKNIIKNNDDIITSIVIPDTLSKLNTTLDNFKLNNSIFSGIKNDFTITIQNENILSDFKKFINASITFDRLNHSQLFFEIWRSHDLLIPLIIETDYILQMTTEPSKYTILKNISFTRNVYTKIDIYNTDEIDSTENDNLDINIETPLISPDDILYTPLIVVKYFKGHKYNKNYTNVNEAYYSPVLVKINIKPYLKNSNFLLSV